MWVFEGDQVLIRGLVAMLGMMESRLIDCRDGEAATRVMREGLNTSEESWMEGLKMAGKAPSGDEE